MFANNYEFDQWFFHKVELRNNNGNTVAMVAMENLNITELPNIWMHNNELKNNNGHTVAHIAAING